MSEEQTIIKQHRSRNFTTVPNTVLNDKRLSWAETGLICYLLGLPDDWHVRTDDLTTRKTNGRDSVRGLQARLEAHGYLQIDRYRDPKTKAWRRTVHVFDEPIERAVPGNPSRLTRPGSPGTANPAQVSRAHSKDSVAKTQRVKNQKQQTTTAAACEPSPAPNAWAGPCVRCSGIVEAGKGVLVGKKPAHHLGECIVVEERSTLQRIRTISNAPNSEDWT